jgi:aminopeptidase
MTDLRLKKLAQVLVNYSVGVKPGDVTIITGNIIALPLFNEVLAEVLQAGGHPIIRMGSDILQETTFRYSSNEQLEWISPIEKYALEEANVLISLRASENTRALSSIDPLKQQTSKMARRDLMATYMKRSAEGSFRWTLTNYPCQAYAQDADMSLREYENFVFKATFCDKDDPVSEWQKVHDEQERLVQWLKGKNFVEVRSPNAELTLSIEDRIFINSDGKKNMPSGEIFTGPVEDSCNGWVKFTYPVVTAGREIEGVYLEFKDGKVVKASAEKNEEYLITQLDTDEGSRYLGEFAIGTNYGIDRFTKNILYDEKIGGSFHMAVGKGYPETGSVNDSAIHWDMICDMRVDSEVLVDGDLFYKNGKFQV